MKVLKIVVATLFVIVLASFSLEPKPKEDLEIKFFQGTFEEAKQLAKQENKLIFMDAYASWCGPCKMMARGTLKKEAVGTFFNANFINLKIDMEKGEGPQLARKFGVRAYPTLVFINSKGEEVAKTVGYHSKTALLEVGELVVASRK